MLEHWLLVTGPILHPTTCLHQGRHDLHQPRVHRAAKGPQLAGSKIIRARMTAGQLDLEDLQETPQTLPRAPRLVPGCVGPPRTAGLHAEQGEAVTWHCP